MSSRLRLVLGWVAICLTLAAWLRFSETGNVAAEWLADRAVEVLYLASFIFGVAVLLLEDQVKALRKRLDKVERSQVTSQG